MTNVQFNEKRMYSEVFLVLKSYKARLSYFKVYIVLFFWQIIIVGNIWMFNILQHLHILSTNLLITLLDFTPAGWVRTWKYKTMAIIVTEDLTQVISRPDHMILIHKYLTPENQAI